MRILKLFTLSAILCLSSALTIAPAFAYSVSAWLPSWDVDKAFGSFKANSDIMGTISPFWYNLSEDGSLIVKENAEIQEIIDFAKENNVPIIPTITNSFNGETVSKVVNDVEIKKQNIQNIVNLVRKFDYDGIDIDYEGLYSGDKEAFTAYIKDLREQLNRYDKKLTIAIQAKTFDTLTKFGDRGQDWAALSQYVDEFRIMTYDYGWRGSIPRPVAPYYWVEDVIEYAVTKVPKEKIYVGVPFYGYGWSDTFFTSYTYETILLILSKYGVDFQYDPWQKTNKLYYVSDLDTREEKYPHELWFENHVSLEPKLELVKKHDLGGIAIWRLGKEDVKNWTTIRKVLKEEPIGDPLYFKDVTHATIYSKEITRLADLGIVKGQGDTFEFAPLQIVNRAEILKMALNSFARDTSLYAFEETRPEDFTNPFKDTPLEQWYFPYVISAVEYEIIKGYPDGTFRPDQKIIRAEAIKLALESAGIDVREERPGEKWYKPYMQWAFDNAIYNPSDFKADEEINRAEAAYIIAKVIETVEEPV